MELTEFIKFATDKGFVMTPPAQKHLSLGEVAKVLDVSPRWVRMHLAEFPHAWRLPASGNAGELRIPSRDVESLASRQRLLRLAVT